MADDANHPPITSHPRKRDGLTIFFWAILTSLYLFFYFFHNESPNSITGSLGWLGWFDQGWYFTSANSLSNFRFEDTHHWYPIGYPLLGALFFKLLGQHLFLIVNLGSFLAFFVYFYRTFRGYLGSWLSLMTFLMALLIPIEIHAPHSVQFPMATQFIIPWNSIPVAAIYGFLIYQTLPLSPPLTAAKSATIGALVGAVFFLRPVDLVALLPLALAFLYKLSHQPSHRGQAIAAVGGFYFTFGPLLLLSLYIHGSLNSDYVQTSKSIGLDFAHVIERFELLFIDATPIFGVKENPLIELQPWLPVALPLFAYWAFLDPKVGGTIVATALTSLATYLGYNDLLPTNLFKFNVIHYFVWLFPYVLAGALVALFHTIKHRKSAPIAFGLSFLFLFFCHGVRLKIERMTGTEALAWNCDSAGREVSVTNLPRQSFDGIRIRGIDLNPRIDFSIQRMQITLNGGDLMPIKDYRLINQQGNLFVYFTHPRRARKMALTLGDEVRACDQSKIELVETRFGLK